MSKSESPRKSPAEESGLPMDKQSKDSIPGEGERHLERPVGAEQDADASPHFDEARVMARVKGLYQEMLNAPVPEEFVRLIRALEEKEAKS